MELEDRVKTLEYEVKLLKNEIQRVLLEIQEQILVHYYPSLRSDAFSSVSAAPAPDLALTVPAAAEKPVIRKVSLEEIRSSQVSTVTPSNKTGPLLAQCSAWAAESSKRIGNSSLRLLIETLGTRGIIGPDTKGKLLQVIPPQNGQLAIQLSDTELLRVMLNLDTVLELHLDADQLFSIMEEVKVG